MSGALVVALYSMLYTAEDGYVVDSLSHVTRVIFMSHLLSPLGNFPEGLYILLAIIFFLYFFTMSKAISVST